MANSEPHIWISSVLLCAAADAPAGGQAEWRWAIGGPLHPLRPLVAADRFPHRITLAIHVRLQRSGDGFADAQLAIWLEDIASTPLRWGGTSTNQAVRHVSVPPPYSGVSEWAQTLILPSVEFPVAGHFRIRAGLTAAPPAVADIGAVTLPMVAVNTSPRQRATDEAATERDLHNVLVELGSHFAPEVHRALRVAVSEARRLNHTSVDTGHLWIALRRILGKKSGLPRAELLREAVEQLEGLYSLRQRERPMLMPTLVRDLREVARGVSGPLDAARLLRALEADPDVDRSVVVEAVRLASRPPR